MLAGETGVKMEKRLKPSLGDGAAVGVLLTVALLGVLYAAQGFLGTPFVPFDLFDWLARVLPGRVVALGIDLIVSVIAALNLEDTSRSAKTAEHIMAIFIVIGIGALVGVLLFSRWRTRKTYEDSQSALIVGVTLGMIFAIITLGINQSSSAFPLISLIWIVIAFAVWGRAFSQVYDRMLDYTPKTSAMDAPDVQFIDRRNFLLKVGGATAAITLVGTGIGYLGTSAGTNGAVDENAGLPAWSDSNKLPNASATVQPAPGTRPEFTAVRDHYRIDINSLPPVLHEDDWTLTVSGLVDNPIELTLDDIRTQYKPLNQFITLQCISNPLGGDLISTQRWTGVPLRDLLKVVKPQSRANYVRITSADGFDEMVSMRQIEDDERIMLAYAWDDLPLTTSHGFPLRVYIPDLYGMKQPKWIVDIEVTDRYEEGYWVRRGWDEVAQVNTTSVVDTIAVDQMIEKGGQKLVPIGGIAFAGKRGISKVEVRIDDGQWNQAELRDPISETTWVIWRYDMPFVEGGHTVYVRCVDGSGLPQIEEYRGEQPSGATGIDYERFNA